MQSAAQDALFLYEQAKSNIYKYDYAAEKITDTLAVSFGFDVAIVWRGFGGVSFPPVDAAWWESPDGSRVLLFHLPRDGYEFGSALPLSAVDAQARWAHIDTELSARNHTGVSLLLSGADHHAAPPNLAAAVRQLTVAARPTAIVRTGLVDAARGVHAAAVRHDEAAATPAVPLVHGELRDSYGYTWTLQGTFATRAYQKRTNARLERALLRDVEPWIALAWLSGGAKTRDVARDGSLTLAQLPSVLQHAWRTLLRTHPHDTLCGCSHDDVATAMHARQRRVTALVAELRESAMTLALQHDRVQARAALVGDNPPVVVRNRAAHARGGVAELTLLETIARVQVGPNSAPNASPDITSRSSTPTVNGCATQRLGQRVKHARRESPQHYPDAHLVREHTILAWVPTIPANGVRVLAADPHAVGTSPRMVRNSPASPVSVREENGRVEVSNGRMTVVASCDGVSLLDGERLIDRVLSLETISDHGDSYTPSLRGKAATLAVMSVRAGARGPLRGSVHLLWQWRDGRERIRVRTTLIVDAGAGHVRCDVRGINKRRNHRLQLVWHTDANADRVVADAAFGPVPRVLIATTSEAHPYEVPPDTMPMHRWVATADAHRGVTMFSDGLAEAHASHSRLAVTLVRAISDLSRNDLPERPGHAGWPTDIPLAQCQGRFSARLGLMLHGAWSDTVLKRVEHTADDLFSPLVGETWRDLAGEPREICGPALRGDGIVASAVTVNDDGSELALRATNVTNEIATGAWSLPIDQMLEACEARLDGLPLTPWSAVKSTIAFTATARAVVTHRVRRRMH